MNSVNEDPPDGYETLAESAEAEIKIRRSRFIALAAPAADALTARAEIDAVSRRFHDCRHVCYAWRLGYGTAIAETRGDAGEPSGSAGEPILVAIRRASLSDCVVVVARYFGGVKLGTGGLGRAYQSAATGALQRAPRRTVALGRAFTLTFPYNFSPTVRRLLALHRGQARDETYGAEVTWQIWLPHSQWRPFASALRESTAGALMIDPP